MSDVKVIRVAGDGSCLFSGASPAIVGSPELQVAERNAQHLCIGQDEQLFELAMAEKLRHDVVSVLKLYQETISSMSQSLPLILDAAVGEHYDSVSQRIEKMSAFTEYDGFLEILAMSFLLQKQFQIFFHNESLNKYE